MADDPAGNRPTAPARTGGPGAHDGQASAVVRADDVADDALAAAAAYARQSLSPATLRAYRADWEDFCQWCQGQHLPPLPAAPATVAGYLASLAASHGRAALHRRLAAIGQVHKLKGLSWSVDSRVRHTLRGILCQHGIPTRRAAALTTAEIRKLVATCDTSLTGLRDRALLLLGYAGALRRSELVAIERAHITFVPDGLRLLIPRSKTDGAGEGAEIGIPRGERRETCPVRALQAWLEASHCDFGPVFRRIDMWVASTTGRCTRMRCARSCCAGPRPPA